jgi:hypothetical protein
MTCQRGVPPRITIVPGTVKQDPCVELHPAFCKQRQNEIIGRQIWSRVPDAAREAIVLAKGEELPFEEVDDLINGVANERAACGVKDLEAQPIFPSEFLP